VDDYYGVVVVVVGVLGNSEEGMATGDVLELDPDVTALMPEEEWDGSSSSSSSSSISSGGGGGSSRELGGEGFR